MLREKEFAVYGDNGLKGTLLSAARFLDPSPEKRVRLEDGRVIVVPSHALIAQPDGSYYFRPTNSEPEAASNAASAAAIATPEPRRSESSYQPPPPPAAEPQREQIAAQRERGAENQRPQQVGPDARQEQAVREPEQQPLARQVFAPSAADPLFREDCDVQRVEVKRIIDKPAEIRQEGDTLIIPLMEEVLVVEKRLMLREELHIKRRRDAKGPGDRVPIAQEQLGR